MVIIRGGQIYLAEEHVAELETAPHQIRERYLGMVQLLQKLAPFTVEQVAKNLDRSVRQVYRYLARFRKEGLRGLFNRSRRPKSTPNKTPPALEEKILEVRAATGLGQDHVAQLVGNVSGRTVHRVLARHGAVENKPRVETEWRRFEWPRPNALLQADLTFYHGVPLFTAQDDHSRHAWACVLRDEDASTVYWAMKHLLPAEYDNLLTDNGPQFARDQPLMREYRLAHLRRKHINARAYHPQTLGKLGAYQKALKRFLGHVVGADLDRLPYWIRVFTEWYNGARVHRGIHTVPNARYFGRLERDADRRLLEAFKLSTLAHSTAGD